MRILVGSPVYQKEEVLNEFLLSLTELDDTNLDINYCFVDDNGDPGSKEALQNFKAMLPDKVTIIDSKENSPYFVDDYTHRWNKDLVKKVGDFKNSIIKFAIEKEYDYLFFIDSDIVLHPKTLQRLILANKEILSNIFWTKWNPQTQELPQVWLKDAYTLHDFNSNDSPTQGEVQQRIGEFLQTLRKPGTYKVGGLGACTLISRSALLKGVSFDPIYNISFWGEDRAFCIRAVALGLELWVDTHYPAYHIYRSEDLAGVAKFKETAKNRDTEILGSKLLDQIINGIQGAHSYSYKDGNLNTSFLKYFSPEEGNRLVANYEKNKKLIIEKRITTKLQITECQITFYNNNSLVIASVKYIESGYLKGNSFYKEFLGSCKLSIVDGEWVITGWEVVKKRVPEFIPLVRQVKEKDNKLTLSMVVKNEGDRYLRRALESAREYIDNAVIIDDGSTDNTVAIIKEVLKDIPLTLIENKESKFNNETELRKQQWYETIATNPDWIVFLDADEIFEDKFKEEIKDMMNNVEVDGYIFRLFDFWDEENYRNDNLWNAHYSYRLFMIRYQKNFRYTFTETAQHCGRMPNNCMSLPHGKSELRLKHYGWARVEDRQAKYERYMRLDPDGKFGSLDQYKSILDPTPIISRWTENE